MKSFLLTHEDKKYMHVNLAQYTKTYDSSGKEDVDIKKVPIGICP